jgi:hypothetical protein
MLRFCVLWTQRRSADSRYRGPGSSVEGDAESVFRPLPAGTWASECSGTESGAAGGFWQKNDGIQTCTRVLRPCCRGRRRLRSEKRSVRASSR